MLDCAHGVLRSVLPALEQQLQARHGYRVHCLGHSMGGGVAALAAHLLRNTPELRARLAGASGVMATGFGTPPVMTRELADAAAAYTRTVVHDVRAAECMLRRCVCAPMRTASRRVCSSAQCSASRPCIADTHVLLNARMQHDFVPRACVASLAVLRAELEAEKQAMLSSNATAAWLRDSGVLEGGQKLVAGICQQAAASMVRGMAVLGVVVWALVCR